MCLLAPRAAKRPRNLVAPRVLEALTVGARMIWDYRVCLARESAHGRTCKKLGLTRERLSA